MSKRGESKLQIITNAEDVVDKLLDLIRNEKYVPKRERVMFPTKVLDVAVDMLIHFSQANGLTLRNDEERYVERRSLQNLAYSEACALETLLNVLWKRYQIPTTLAVEVSDCLQYIIKKFDNWQKSDFKRYQAIVAKGTQKPEGEEA